jgi:hypothetical protein
LSVQYVRMVHTPRDDYSHERVEEHLVVEWIQAGDSERARHQLARYEL